MLIQSALVALAATVVTAVKPIEVKGNEFYVAETGKRFQMVGVGYQPGGSAGYKVEEGKDPLTDVDACMRDAALMQVLGVNTVRVYNLNPDANHDECVSIFNAAGMYLVIDVNSPKLSITSYEPWTSYYAEYLNRTFAVVEAFANYPNTLMFFSANELIQKEYDAKYDPPYIRAVTRDLKNYIKNHIDRQIPVGYSAADWRDVLYDTWNYCQCKDEDEPMSRSDVFGLNSYSWCGTNATYESSTYEELTANFESTSVPVFFSEYGCNQPDPHERVWDETQALYGDKMTPTFSGGLVYEWTEEPDKQYGLINITGDTTHIMGDYTRLKKKLAKLDWESLQSQDATMKDIDPPKCESELIKEDVFNSNFTLPQPPDDGSQELIEKGIENKPKGKIVDISDFTVKMAVKDEQGNDLKDLKVVKLADDDFNWPGKNTADTGKEVDSDTGSDSGSDKGDKGDGDKPDDEDAAMLTRPMMWAVALPAVAMFFA